MVSTDKDVDNGKFWHPIFTILLVHWHPRMKWTVPRMGGPKEQCVSLKITQLMLHTFTVDENVDRRQNNRKDIVPPHSCYCAFT